MNDGGAVPAALLLYGSVKTPVVTAPVETASRRNRPRQNPYVVGIFGPGMMCTSVGRKELLAPIVYHCYTLLYEEVVLQLVDARPPRPGFWHAYCNSLEHLCSVRSFTKLPMIGVRCPRGQFHSHEDHLGRYSLVQTA